MLFELAELILDIGMRLWKEKSNNKVKKLKDNEETKIKKERSEVTLTTEFLIIYDVVFFQIVETDLAEKVRIILWANGYIKQNFNYENI